MDGALRLWTTCGDLVRLPDRRFHTGCPAHADSLSILPGVTQLRLVASVDDDRGVAHSGVLERLRGQSFGAVLADPPWRFINRSGKVAPEHRRLARYETMTTKAICELPVADIVAPSSHLYLWVPNALLADGLAVLESWGFTYKTNLVWHKIRKDGGSDGRGVGFYFRNVTELVLFGVRGRLRTAAPGRRQVNLLASKKREHSRKPDELYDIIEACSPAPSIELFARYRRENWSAWGLEAADDVTLQGVQYPASS